MTVNKTNKVGFKWLPTIKEVESPGLRPLPPLSL